MESQLVLPIAVVSPTDIARLVRELDNLDEFFRQSAIRQGGQPQSPPRYSRLLDEVVVANKVNLLDQANREAFMAHIKNLQQSAPVIHISFSTDPPGPYVQKIVAWLRENMGADILVRVGLQPNIGAGCVVRTTNRSFDLSLRRFFDGKRDFFMQKLHEVLTQDDAAPVAAAQSQPAAQPVVVEAGAQA